VNGTTFSRRRACCDRCRRSPLPFATAIAAPPGASRIDDPPRRIGESFARSIVDPVSILVSSARRETQGRVDPDVSMTTRMTDTIIRRGRGSTRRDGSRRAREYSCACVASGRADRAGHRTSRWRMLLTILITTAHATTPTKTSTRSRPKESRTPTVPRSSGPTLDLPTASACLDFNKSVSPRSVSRQW